MLAATVTAPSALLLALVLVLLGAAPASAHARFTGSDPAEGAQLPTLPAAVVMSYSEEIAPQFVETAVVTPDGTTVPTAASVAGTDVSVDLAGADLTAAGGHLAGRRAGRQRRRPPGRAHHELRRRRGPAPPTAAAAPSAAPGAATAPAAADARHRRATDRGRRHRRACRCGRPDQPRDRPGRRRRRPAPVGGRSPGPRSCSLAAAAALVVQLRRRPPTG